MIKRIYSKLMECEDFDDYISLELSKAEALFLMSVLLDYPELMSKNYELEKNIERLEDECDVLAHLCNIDGKD